MGNNKRSNRNFIDDMVDIFGYDYVIGFCLCSEYDIRKRADKTEDEGKSAKLYATAKRYADKAEQRTKERVENGL